MFGFHVAFHGFILLLKCSTNKAHCQPVLGIAFKNYSMYTLRTMNMTTELSTEEAAARLGVSQRSVQEFINRGHFPGAHKLDPTRSNSPYRIPLRDVEKFLRLRQVAK
jgi:excisionase family DNA binding protein